MIKAILTDIEGTTSSLSFVKDVLFPYARARLADYVLAHEADLADIFEDVRALEKNAALSTQEIIAVLLRWIDEDRKATPLKLLQGMIWESGYKNGDFQGHIYDDAFAALESWHRAGLRLYVYSSGSVPAQKLLFSHTARGDLTSLFSGYFDTTTGPKLEAASYKKIAAEIGLPASNILFLSDHLGETESAKAAGMRAVLIDREGHAKNAIKNFNEINLQEAS
jgi:enolase-phosphatase E1